MAKARKKGGWKKDALSPVDAPEGDSITKYTPKQKISENMSVIKHKKSLRRKLAKESMKNPKAFFINMHNLN